MRRYACMPASIHHEEQTLSHAKQLSMTAAAQQDVLILWSDMVT